MAVKPAFAPPPERPASLPAPEPNRQPSADRPEAPAHSFPALIPMAETVRASAEEDEYDEDDDEGEHEDDEDDDER